MYPNLSILNSLSTIRAFCPPLPRGRQSKRILNEVEVKVEVKVWNGLSNQVEVKVKVEVWNER